VLLRVVDEPWPFPPHYPIVPQPLAALDLLDYPEFLPRRVGREVLAALAETKPAVLARRSARARAMSGPLLGKVLELRGKRGTGQRPRVEGDPKSDARAAAAHIVGVLWASASQAVTVKELRAAIGLSRERLEARAESLVELLADPRVVLGGTSAARVFGWEFPNGTWPGRGVRRRDAPRRPDGPIRARTG
jgi:hypothetical protein